MNNDGVVYNQDGSVTITQPDGTVVTLDRNGNLVNSTQGQPQAPSLASIAKDKVTDFAKQEAQDYVKDQVLGSGTSTAAAQTTGTPLAEQFFTQGTNQAANMSTMGAEQAAS